MYLRREATYLGDAIDKSKQLYPHFGATFVASPRAVWRFPSGAQGWFSHIEHKDDVRNYDSFEFQTVLFDELTHFEESMYTGLLARLRTSDPSLPCLMRAGTNPGGPGHDWVFARWGAWLDKEHKRPAQPGRLRWYVGDDEVARDTPNALSRTFIPALISDNPHVQLGYEAKLHQLDALRRAQLLHGDWLAKPAAGLLFKRPWFEIVDRAPVQVRSRCRYWDRAATEATVGKDPDWSVGARWSLGLDDYLYVEHVDRFRGRPSVVQERVKHNAQVDGRECAIVLEQDPGQAGVAEIEAYTKLLLGFNVRAIKPTGDKVTRAQPASAQAEQKRIRIVRGDWNQRWLDEHEAFPEEGVHDDQVDTTSGAVAYLSGNVPASLAGFGSIMTNANPQGLGMLR